MKKKQVYIETEITAVIRMHVPANTPDAKVKTVAKELLCQILPQSGEVLTEFANDCPAEFYVECTDLNMTAILEDPDF